MKTEYWGMISYAEAWKKQTDYFNELLQARLRGDKGENCLVFCEHYPVFTLGKHAKEGNVLLPEEALRQMGVEVFHVDRGGDVTFHGPGQLVCYPILNLEDFSLGLKGYLSLLEEAVMKLCAYYGIVSGRVKGATGVWLDPGRPEERKICAMGVRSSHFITMHGLALNVNTCLDYFHYINPCGFVDKGVTSLQQELKFSLPMQEVQERLQAILLEMFEERSRSR